MYIAIEGIKGSGKSTLIGSLFGKEKFMNTFEYFPITAPMHSSHPLEQLLLKNEILRHDDTFIETLFVHRANWHYKMIKTRSKLIIGDRSIATACVTRWSNWGDPYFSIERVKKQHERIKPPNIVIWLDTDTSIAKKRINSREGKITGLADEFENTLNIASKCYHELFESKVFQRKIGKIQTIKLKNEYSINQTEEEILNILKFYSKK